MILLSKYVSLVRGRPKWDNLIKRVRALVFKLAHASRIVHIWEYKHYPGYTDTQKMLAQDATYQSFLKQLAPMLRSRENQIVLEFSFWEAAKEVTDPQGIYELRSYLLKVSFV